ncbi:MAG TPA: DHA2 family efflux MFS transporter permease subunit [Armatimonadota bacterium]|jgi:DHA2 family multidrug resistance protein
MTTTHTAPAAEYHDYTQAQRWIILLAVMLGTLMTVVDGSIVNVAIPSMMGNLGATLSQISWVSTGYIIANVIMLPLTGWFSARFGRKYFLASSMILFTVASLLCGLASSLPALIIFRIMQGAGGAALLSTSQATMMEIFPPQQLGMVQAIYGIGVMVGPTVGPTLGGWLTDNYNWPWIFLINLPIGIVATILTIMFVHDSKHQRRSNVRIDFIGIALLAIGLGCLQMFLEKGNDEGWLTSNYICILIAFAISALLAFVIWELRTPNPAVNLRILKNRGFAAGTVYATVLGVGLYGGIFILPVFLQQLRSYTAMQTGLIMLPGAIATTIAMPIVGKLIGKFPARNMVAIGALAFVVSMFMLRNLTMDTGPEQMFWPLVLRGASMGFLFVPLTLATLLGLKGREIGEGTGLYNLARQLGGSAGIALLTTFLDHRTAFHRAALIERISMYNPLATQRLAMLQQFFHAKGATLATAGQQALATINGIIQGQATVLAFEDAFLFIGGIFVIAMPLLLLFKRSSGDEVNAK